MQTQALTPHDVRTLAQTLHQLLQDLSPPQAALLRAVLLSATGPAAAADAPGLDRCLTNWGERLGFPRQPIVQSVIRQDGC